jgi:hypothetical protein
LTTSNIITFRASYFGTLSHRSGEEPFAFAVDYNGAPVKVEGKDAVSGKYLLYIVEQTRAQ